MRRFVVAISIWVLLGFVQCGSTQAQVTVRIWPVGDSITDGCCSDSAVEGGYRTYLYTLLSNAGYNVDYVGTLRDDNPPAALGDPDHEGHGGYRVDEIDAGVESWLNQIEDPDVILLLIGVNDFLQTYDTAHAINRLQSLIEHLASLRPYAKILVANLLAVPGNSTADSLIQSQFNPFVPGVVSSEVSLGRQVSFVDMHSCCGTGDFATGGVHPNQTGYSAMANTWHPSITSVIQPLGTTNSPAILRTEGKVDLRHVAVTFSKPVADSSTSLANFALSGGVSITSASLDSSKRVITLTTSQQTPATTYTLTVSGVQDRTAQANVISPGSTSTFQSGPIAEGANYVQVYSLSIPSRANFHGTDVPYQVDNHATIGGFSRIAYFWQLQPSGGGSAQYLWVSMDAFTQDPGKIGVPTYQSGAFFQQSLANMNVRSSVAGVPNADGLTGGNIEFWWGTYGPNNAAHVPGASDTTYDFGDSASAIDPPGYGSMQIHDAALGTTLFAYNGWGSANQTSDLGLGNSAGVNPDWTFAANANTYVTKKLEVYILPTAGSSILTVSSTNPDRAVTVTVSPSDQNGLSSGSTEFSRVYTSGTTVNLTAPVSANGASFQKWQKDGVDFSTSNAISIALDASHNLRAVYLSGADAPSFVTEATNYTLVYSLILPNHADYTTSPVPYEVDRHASIGAFSRIGYLVELQDGGALHYLWISTEAFTTDPGKIGVPTLQSGAVFQQYVTNMTVQSSAAGIVTGNGITTGNLEFWPYNYFPGNSANVPGASATVFDWGDQFVTDYPALGSMQIHNWGAGQTLFAFNLWSGGVVCDLGIGNAPVANTDWSDVQNAGSYTLKKLQVYVLPTRTLTITTTNTVSAVPITVSPNDAGGLSSGVTSFSRNYPNGTVVSVSAPGIVSGRAFRKWQLNGADYSTGASTTLTVNSDDTLTAIYSPWTLTINSSLNSTSPLTGASVAVSPNDTSGFGNGTTSFTRTYLDGTVISVTAATSVSGNVFLKWQKNGVDYSNGLSTSVGIDSDATLTAVYAPWTLTVDSVNPGSGVTTTLSPTDSSGLGGGSTSLTRTYTNGTVVSLTAQFIASGNHFEKWQTNGVDYSTGTTTSLTMNTNYVATAFYVPWTLTVQSFNPSANVSVGVSPLDTGSQGNGATPFARSYTDGTVVNLSAPASVGANTFAKWQTNGVDYSTSASVSVTMNADYTAKAVYASQVQGAHVFYNNSAWDNNDASANASDDQAIATDKVPLRRGSAATFANYTSYSRGINGVMVDISSIPGTLTSNDFTFKVGNDNNPDAWPAGPSPSSVRVRSGAGVNSSDRVTLIWPDKAVAKEWLEVTVLANNNTGLATPYRFYFGNAVGETGDTTGSGDVVVNDALRILNHLVLNVPITNIYDIDRDRNVVVNDALITLNNLVAGSQALQWIDLSGLAPASLSGSLQSATQPKVSLNSIGLAGAVTQAAGGLGQSTPGMSVNSSGSGYLILELSAPSGQEYRVQSTDSLGNSDWIDGEFPVSVSPSGVRRWILPVGVDAPQRFYRIAPAATLPRDIQGQ